MLSKVHSLHFLSPLTLSLANLSFSLLPIFRLFFSTMESNQSNLPQTSAELKRKKEEKKTNFRWSNEMTKHLLEFLAEEVRSGNRPNNTFRTSSLVSAASFISEKFHTKCLPVNVEHHLKTLRSSWQTIAKVRDNSGFGWDDNLKMVTVSPNAYSTYVKAYPSHEKYLNKKIDMYDEMSIVVGKDVATGSFAKTFSDIQATSDNPTHENVPSESANSSDSRQQRKRARNEVETVDISHISEQLDEVVSALKNFSSNQLDVEKLYNELMKMEDVEESVRVAAFDHLAERVMLAKAFLVKSVPQRKIWLQNFMKTLG